MINNLMISTVEFRDQNDPEILEHTHDKSVEQVIVQRQPEMIVCYQLLQDVMSQVIAPLLEAKVFWTANPESVTRYGLLTSLQDFKKRCKNYRNAARLSALFNQGIFLASLGENLDCGLRLAVDFINASMEKAWLKEINKYPAFKQLGSKLQKLISDNYEHPKIQKLITVLKSHFAASPPGSRVIIFTSLKDTVTDLVQTLNRQEDTTITARWFIGQSSGFASGKHKMTQVEQKRVIQDFRQAKFNTLVATCIAEEGLDIPEVQLIVCFDGAASPLRDIQRMGRTGRHETGRVIYLLAEGKEQRKFNRNNNETGYIKSLLSRAMYHFKFYESSPIMIPAEYKPEMTKVHMQTTHPKDLQQSSRKREGSVVKTSDTKQRRLDSFMTAPIAEDVQQPQTEHSAVINLVDSPEQGTKVDKSTDRAVATVIYCQKANEALETTADVLPSPLHKTGVDAKEKQDEDGISEMLSQPLLQRQPASDNSSPTLESQAPWTAITEWKTEKLPAKKRTVLLSDLSNPPRMQIQDTIGRSQTAVNQTSTTCTEAAKNRKHGSKLKKLTSGIRDGKNNDCAPLNSENPSKL